MLEKDLKRAAVDYLEIGQAQGRWFYLRLNAGSFILTDKEGNFRRRVQGAKAGTADFEIIQYMPTPFSQNYAVRVTFVELKSRKGKTTKAQDEFAVMVESFGCVYVVIRSLDELITLLED